jgi:AcrR family transcriptional regulator
MTSVKRRAYRSPLRAQRAEETRRSITDAARRLLEERAAAGVTIEEIAAEAGVSAATVYATFGSKVGILLAILDELTAGAGLPDLPGRLARGAGDPRRQLALYVQFDRRLFDAGRQIIGVALGLRSADPDVDAWFAEGERRRRVNQAPLVRGWADSGALRPELGERRAADILWAMTGPAVHRLFVVDAGWPSATYERWLRTVLEHELFGADVMAGPPRHPA